MVKSLSHARPRTVNHLLLGIAFVSGDWGVYACECVAVCAEGDVGGGDCVVRHYWVKDAQPEVVKGMGLIIVIILILLLLGGLPRWGYSQNWGYGPSGIIGVLLVVILILFLLGRL